MIDIVNTLWGEIMETEAVRIERDPLLQQMTGKRNRQVEAVSLLLGDNAEPLEELSDLEAACSSRYGRLMFREGMSLCLRLLLELV